MKWYIFFNNDGESHYDGRQRLMLDDNGQGCLNSHNRNIHVHGNHVLSNTYRKNFVKLISRKISYYFYWKIKIIFGFFSYFTWNQFHNFCMIIILPKMWMKIWTPIMGMMGMMKSRATVGANTWATIIWTTTTAHDNKATDEGQLKGLRRASLIVSSH